MNDAYLFKKPKRKPRFKGYMESSDYITMRDGVKIAAEIWLPKDLSVTERVPTVLVQTRYWRAILLKPFIRLFRKPAFEPKEAKIMTAYGYALVCIDVRGCGASQGTRLWPFSEEEVADGKEVIDWIINQPWSNGKVVTVGNSYTGQTAELLVTNNHPALKASIPKHNAWDPYAHIGYPGGMFLLKFVEYWAKLGSKQDQDPGNALIEFEPFLGKVAKVINWAIIKSLPVESDKDLSIYKAALKEHRANKYIIDYRDIVAFRDDAVDEKGRTLAMISVFPNKDKIEKANIPLYCWGSWMDSASADVVISRFMTFDVPQIAIISDFDHSDHYRASPFYKPTAKANPKFADQIKSWISFFDDCLEDKGPKDKTLYYFTMGEEKWKMTTTWPPEGQTFHKWYLSKGNTLSQEAPNTDDGADEYTINYNHTTGLRNRWYTLLKVPVSYPGRLEEDKKLLCYTSPPLNEDIEVTGNPIITLQLSSTHEDGAIIAYLEFINEEGKVKHITEGHLRLMCRKLSDETPPYKIFTPYHSYKRADAIPMKPGVTEEITFGLISTAILIPKGSRLRVAIAGADKDMFDRYPKEGTPTITIQRNKAQLSYIELPIITRK